MISKKIQEDVSNITTSIIKNIKEELEAAWNEVDDELLRWLINLVWVEMLKFWLWKNE